MTYDQAGNANGLSPLPDADNNMVYAYDAEGRKCLVPSNEGTINYYDGDGTLVKQYASGWVNPNTGDNGIQIHFTSTLLRGAVLTTYSKVSGVATRDKDYVYAQGEMIVEQGNIAPTYTKFHHRDDTARLTILGTTVSSSLFDPLGNPADPPAPEQVILSPYEFTGAGGGFQSGNCFLDGFQAPCSMVYDILSGDAGARGGLETSRYNQERQQWEFPTVTPSGQLAWVTTLGGVSGIFLGTLDGQPQWYDSNENPIDASIQPTQLPTPPRRPQLILTPPWALADSTDVVADDPCRDRGVNTQLPANGTGYYTYGPAYMRFGEAGVIANILNLASAWNQVHPRHQIGIGDIGQQGGQVTSQGTLALATLGVLLLIFAQ